MLLIDTVRQSVQVGRSYTNGRWGWDWSDEDGGVDLRCEVEAGGREIEDGGREVVRWHGE
jgi:hypothetical protein